MSVLTEAAAGLLDLLGPLRCPACDATLFDDEDDFCGACAPLIEAAPLALRPPARAASLHAFGGPLGDAIRRLKYERRTDLLAPLQALLVCAAPSYAGLVDGVLPVPLHRSRLAARGFNQSALLAKPLARSLGVPLLIGSVRRIRPTPPQVGLDAEGRRRNVAGAFVVRRSLPPRVLLVDDVRTTGATLAELARVLGEAGSDVRTLTLARAALGE